MYVNRTRVNRSFRERVLSTQRLCLFIEKKVSMLICVHKDIFKSAVGCKAVIS